MAICGGSRYAHSYAQSGLEVHKRPELLFFNQDYKMRFWLNDLSHYGPFKRGNTPEDIFLKRWFIYFLLSKIDLYQ